MNGLTFDNFVSSEFTRSKGFINIKTHSLKKKNSIEILNSFIPQGASPSGSFRISKVNQEFIGVGYYQMIDNSNAKIHTLLARYHKNLFEKFLPPLFNEVGELESLNPLTMDYGSPYNEDQIYPIRKNFSHFQIASILYSLLTGDNILLVDKNPHRRIKFIANFLNFVPKILFYYNRITSGCLELDGNENIVGVNELPRKYRSHKKLYLPLDTIFIDLENNMVEGDGLKHSEYTNYLANLFWEDENRVYLELKHFMQDIYKQKPSIQTKYNEKDLSLISRVQSQLGIGSTQEEEWIMF